MSVSWRPNPWCCLAMCNCLAEAWQLAIAVLCAVQDDHPALPPSVSPLLQDFLMQCFRKVCVGLRMIREEDPAHKCNINGLS